MLGFSCRTEQKEKARIAEAEVCIATKKEEILKDCKAFLNEKVDVLVVGKILKKYELAKEIYITDTEISDYQLRTDLIEKIGIIVKRTENFIKLTEI